MSLNISKSEKWFLGLFFLILTGTLINSNLFVYPALVSWFLFAIVISILTIFTSIRIIIINSYYQNFITFPIVLFIVWAIYVGLYPFLTNKYNGNLKDWIIIASSIFFISSSILFSINKFLPNNLYRVIFWIGVGESLICMLQFAGIINSWNSNFDVTGTHGNPNVTAMFLAMTMATAFIAPPSFKLKVLWRAGICLIIVALLMLKCRTAIIGTVVVTMVMLNSKFGWLAEIKKNKKKQALIVLLAFVFVIPITFHLYRLKEASADSRLTVWRISLDMFTQKPITGYGYGLFERNYNLFQANYFKNGQASVNEIENSGHIRMAYNEIIENAVEGGIVGMLLFAGIIISLIASFFTIKNRSLPTSSIPGEKDQIFHREIDVAFAGIAGFTAMSMVNFTVQAIPVLCMFIVYAAVISAGLAKTQQENSVPQIKWLIDFYAFFSFCQVYTLVYRKLISQLGK